MPSRRGQHTQARTPARRLAGACAIAIAALALAMGSAEVAVADTAPSSVATGPVKYFIVPQPQNGQDVTLFDIAQNTLGDGNRYMEIFQLNQGKQQPDGDHFTDPTSIEPGLVLQLPPDAQGPGVQFGPLPAEPGPPTSGTPSATSSHTRAPAPAAPAAARASAATSSGGPLIAGAAGIALLSSVAGFFLARSRRRRRSTVAAATVAPSPVAPRTAAPSTAAARRDVPVDWRDPGQRPQATNVAVPVPPPVAGPTRPRSADSRVETNPVMPAIANGTPTVRLTSAAPGISAPAPNADQTPAPVPNPVLAPPTVPPPVAPPAPAALTPEATPPAPTSAAMPPASVPKAEPRTAEPRPSERPEHKPSVDGDLFFEPFQDDKRPATPGSPEPAAPHSVTANDEPSLGAAEFTTGVLTHDVVFEEHRLQVRLDSSVADGHRRGTPLSWTELPHIVPSDGSFVYVGTADRGCLFIDLSAAPGPISLDGDAHATGRIADSILLQASGLSHDHRPQILVAGQVGRLIQPGLTVHRFRCLDDCAKALAAGIATVAPDARFQLLACPADELAQPGTLDRLRAAATLPLVVFTVGQVPDSPWRISVSNATPSAVGQSTDGTWQSQLDRLTPA